jgi:hypothetical protein
VTLSLKDPNTVPRGDRAYPITLPVQCALIRMLEGTAIEGDLELLGLALNLTSARLQILRHREGLALIERAGPILVAIDQGKVPSLAKCHPAERQLVIDAVDLYVEAMRASTPYQMDTARQLAHKQMMAAIAPPPKAKGGRR